MLFFSENYIILYRQYNILKDFSIILLFTMILSNANDYFILYQDHSRRTLFRYLILGKLIQHN